MKIINREKFLKLPSGVLYAKYQPQMFDEVCIKWDSWENDWVYQDILNVKSNDSGEMIDILIDAEENGTSFDLDLECAGRDGLYDKDQLFAVFELKDVAYLIARLQMLLPNYPDYDDIG